MVVSKSEFERAEARAFTERDAGHVRSARYDRRRQRVVAQFNTGVEVAFPTALAEGLAGASTEDLAKIEVSPTGLSLHWPRLNADLYVPALLSGVSGSKSWMASHRRRQSAVVSQSSSGTQEWPQGRAPTQPS